ncbi:leucine-rich repeat domain-containing protein [Thalassotalea crassostreae]|uniref:leucine-rich repeat domain-containing protein n=1 Tax=Thalassotalea crassostreae TaxID=1763536 RepID=UPI00083816AC|nr:leucine-rich repeat domain-containing protein [Thalassotalea crassostreae]
MKLQKITMLSLAILTLAACDDGVDSSGNTETFDKFLASIEYQDANLKACVESSIEEQDVKTSAELTSLVCTDAIESVTGLANFKELVSIDLTESGLSCALLDTFDQQLAADAAALGDDTPAVTVQPESCFYNGLIFTDSEFRGCVVEQFATNGWSSVEEVTTLTCNNQLIVNMDGVEIFTNLTDLDITNTSINCADTAAYVAANEGVTVASPSVCIIANIDMSEDVAACIEGQTPPSGLVVDFKQLTCSSPEFTDVKGLEKLTSLTDLVLSDTNVDCYDNRDFEEQLLDTINYSGPSSCIITETSTFDQILRESGDPSDPIFTDPLLQECFDDRVAEGAWTMVGQVTSLNCGSADYKYIESLQGVENFAWLTTLYTNKPSLPSAEGFEYIADLELLIDINIQYSDTLKAAGDETLQYLINNVSQLQKLNINGYKGLDYATIKNFDNPEVEGDGLVFLKLMGSALDDAALVEIATASTLEELYIGNNPNITSILAFKDMPNLTVLDINHKNTANIKCSDIDTLTSNGITVITGVFTCVP